MADINLLVHELRAKGHVVEYVHPVPGNAGDFELTVNGNPLNLEQARLVLESDFDKTV